MNYYSENVMSLVGIISAVVHVLVRLLAGMYPKMTPLLLNVMLIVNIGLIVYYGYALYEENKN